MVVSNRSVGKMADVPEAAAASGRDAGQWESPAACRSKSDRQQIHDAEPETRGHNSGVHASL